jgi:nucleotide-binding universal stress UspA family protein
VISEGVEEVRGLSVAGSFVDKEEIVELAEELGAGLIVMGSRGHSRLRRALMGSVSDAVVRHAHCRVTIVRE